MSSYFSRSRYDRVHSEEKGLPGSSKRTAMSSGFKFPKRYGRLLLTAVVLLGLWLFFRSEILPQDDSVIPYPEVQDIGSKKYPPLYERYREYENRLPTQEGLSERKYIFFQNHQYGCGWGNALQDMIFSTLIATGSNRGFVRHDYTWSYGSKYADYNGKKIPSSIPVSTMLSGYLLGLPLHHGNETLPIPLYHYEQICPPKDRVLVNRTSVEEFRKLDPSKIWDLGEMTGKDVLAAWLERLEQPDLVNERCLEVRMPSALVFDIWLLGTSRIQSLWDTVANAPVLTGWAWSPLVYRAYEKNRDIIVPRLSGILKRAVVATGLSNTPSLTGVRDDNVPLPLLTLHLRRGDYEGHCEHLAEWSSSYTGQNSFPEFADKDGFVVPRVVEGSKPEDAKPGDPPLLSSQEEKKKYYMKHCYPDISQVVTRVREVVHDYEHAVRTGDGKKRGQDHLEERSARDVEETLSSRKSDRKSLGNETLRGIFIMTNGDREYLKEVKKALSDDAERSKQEGSGKKDDWDFEWTWENIATSRDMELGWEEKTVGQAVDMYVAQRSEVFVGNGFSSLTGNIVMLRMFAKLDPVQIRFW